MVAFYSMLLTCVVVEGKEVAATRLLGEKDDSQSELLNVWTERMQNTCPNPHIPKAVLRLDLQTERRHNGGNEMPHNVDHLNTAIDNLVTAGMIRDCEEFYDGNVGNGMHCFLIGARIRG